nr:cell wall-binding repeat-containing protein [Clostridia bacterium]
MVLLEEGDDPDDPEPGEGPLEQTITAEDITAVFGDPARPIGASTDGDGTLSYEVTAGNDVVMVFSNGDFRPLKAGVATITITASGTEAYLPATKDITVTVEPKPLTNDMLSKPNDVNESQTGHVFTPDITVTDGDTRLVIHTDYELSYDNNSEPGTAVVIATGKGNYTGVAETTFTIIEDLPFFTPADPLVRVSGKNRFETAFAIADAVKYIRNDEPFNCAIVANSQSFADALSGTYLSTKKTAPILLVKPGYQKSVDDVINYIRQNVRPGVTVYLLGGEAVVPNQVEEELQGEYRVRRLYGKSRYETNIEILKEAGVKRAKNILICDGRNFPDALSASATGYPILLVSPSLSKTQTDYLDKIKGYGLSPVAIGGEAAVSEATMGEVERYLGQGERVFGKNRYYTCAEVAKRFFGCTFTKTVLASGRDFPDGLCGGLLSKVMRAPLLLTSNYGQTDQGILDFDFKAMNNVVMLGGESAVEIGSAIRLLRLKLNEVVAMFPEVDDYLASLAPEGWKYERDGAVYYSYKLNYALTTQDEVWQFQRAMNQEFPRADYERILHQVKEDLGLYTLTFEFTVFDSSGDGVWNAFLSENGFPY